MLGRFFWCASPINLPSSVKKKWITLTCWEHFFCTLIGVSPHHSPECVHACVFVRLQCVHLLGGNLLDFFLSLLPPNLFLSFSLAFFLTLLMHVRCMFFYMVVEYCCVCFFKFEFSFDLFDENHLKTVFISATLVGESVHTNTETKQHKRQNDKWIYETKRRHDESSFHHMQT